MPVQPAATFGTNADIQAMIEKNVSTKAMPPAQPQQQQHCRQLPTLCRSRAAVFNTPPGGSGRSGAGPGWVSAT